jgi:hypothetical protein
MDGNYISKANGMADAESGILKFEVTSRFMSQSEIARALDVPGATVHLESERLIAEILADCAGNILSRMFTCRFILTEAAHPS